MPILRRTRRIIDANIHDLASTHPHPVCRTASQLFSSSINNQLSPAVSTIHCMGDTRVGTTRLMTASSTTRSSRILGLKFVCQYSLSFSSALRSTRSTSSLKRRIQKYFVSSSSAQKLAVTATPLEITYGMILPSISSSHSSIFPSRTLYCRSSKSAICSPGNLNFIDRSFVLHRLLQNTSEWGLLAMNTCPTQKVG